MKNIFRKNFITPQYNKNGVFLNQIHSFKSRSRPLKKNIIDILKHHWCDFGISFTNQLIDLNNIFYKKLPIILEIGFGTGQSLFETAVRYQRHNILGIEVYTPGIGSLIKKVISSKIKINNLKIIAHDAVEVLQNMIHDNTIDVIQLFFPDPWPKTCHHKRRILQFEFLQLIYKKLIYNGILHVVTDCISYAKHILRIINNMHCVVNISSLFHGIALTKVIRSTSFGRKAIFNKNKIFNFIFQFR